VGTTYYSLIRTTLIDGTLLFSNSNGVKVIAIENQPEFTPTEEAPVLLAGLAIQPKKIYSKQARSYVTDSCSIDEDNRCRQVQQSNVVGQYLNQVYGPPVWFQTSQAGILYRIPTTAAIAEEIGIPGYIGLFTGSSEPYYLQTSNSTYLVSYNSEDEGNGPHLSPGGIVAIAVAVPVGSGLVLLAILLLILFIVLIIIILVVVVCVLLKPKKFEENYQVKTNDVVDSDIGHRTEAHMGDSNTRVEFPDLDAPS